MGAPQRAQQAMSQPSCAARLKSCGSPVGLRMRLPSRWQELSVACDGRPPPPPFLHPLHPASGSRPLACMHALPPLPASSCD